MALLQEFLKNIRDHHLFQKNDYLLLAVSGGIDSVVLSELCFQAGFHFRMAHCNFQLRGEESERDEKFVAQLAEKYGTKVFIEKFDTEKYAEENSISIQVAARELRYEWFEQLMSDNRALGTDNHNQTEIHRSPSDSYDVITYLLTAHHANDNIETLLMNFFKGTGIKGLQGILTKQKKIIRPLLFAKRKEIELFARENNLQFVEDSSNNSDKYTRNYFRHQLIPSIEKVFPKAEENLINNIERFGEIEILYQQSVQFHKKKLMEYKGNEIHIPVLKLSKIKPLKTVLYEIIKDFGFTAHQTPEVLHLMNSESGKYVSSSTHRILKNRAWLIIAPVNTVESNHILIQENDTRIDFENGILKFKKYENRNEKLADSMHVAMLDLKNIAFPLLLRKCKQGDYFYPLGMQNLPAGRPGKKKLSKFFIDRKIPLTEKEKIWVIESNKRIIWVIGQRIDDRIKITGKTKEILEIQFNKW